MAPAGLGGGSRYGTVGTLEGVSGREREAPGIARPGAGRRDPRPLREPELPGLEGKIAPLSRAFCLTQEAAVLTGNGDDVLCGDGETSPCPVPT